MFAPSLYVLYTKTRQCAENFAINKTLSTPTSGIIGHVWKAVNAIFGKIDYLSEFVKKLRNFFCRLLLQQKSDILSCNSTIDFITP
jgi:hypothetical protein